MFSNKVHVYGVCAWSVPSSTENDGPLWTSSLRRERFSKNSSLPTHWQYFFFFFVSPVTVESLRLFRDGLSARG